MYCNSEYDLLEFVKIVSIISIFEMCPAVNEKIKSILPYIKPSGTKSLITNIRKIMIAQQIS